MNGVSYYDLEKIGISFSDDYTAGGKIVFDEEKFKTAMDSDPEKVSDLFTGTHGIVNTIDTVSCTHIACLQKKGEKIMVKNEKEGILLESGTNEIEVMKFTVLGEFYGINVAKVQEIIMSEKVKPMPHANPAVEGIFKPRDELITVINLAKYLTGDDRENGPRDLFIVTNFNKMTVAFRVDSIEGISRISWKDIQKPDKTIANGDDSVATGIAPVSYTHLNVYTSQVLYSPAAASQLC